MGSWRSKKGKIRVRRVRGSNRTAKGISFLLYLNISNRRQSGHLTVLPEQHEKKPKILTGEGTNKVALFF